MRILLLARAFNRLTQRLWVELERRGHAVSLELDVNDAVLVEAVALARPELVIASYLTRALPEAITRAVRCLVVHPGPPGDRGPSSLDRAILEGRSEWGVTLLEAETELDAGPVWASRSFPLRAASKSSLYRNEVAAGAVACVLEAIERLADPTFRPVRRPGPFRPRLAPAERRIDWSSDPTELVLRKLRAADGSPGVEDELLGLPVRLYDAYEEGQLRGPPGALIARREEAVCRATVDGAVWIGWLRSPAPPEERPFKVPATLALAGRLAGLPEIVPPLDPGIPTFRPIGYREEGGVGRLRFAHRAGALGTAQARRLLAALERALARPIRVLVLEGGPDFWCSGMNLATIEAAASPAEESLANIEAIDDLAEAVIRADHVHTIAALGADAGAGGAFLALAADEVIARADVLVSPHYKNMGNLFGSEYWTYLLPRRAGERGREVLAARLPVGAEEARRLGLVDTVLDLAPGPFEAAVLDHARRHAADPALAKRLAAKRARLAADEARKPLAAYRAEELAQMRRNFFGFDPSYHVARYHFLTRVPHARTPFHLARHRTGGIPDHVRPELERTVP
jgi:putative two-component system hydrogenase maturation factor HypX/HoxX